MKRRHFLRGVGGAALAVPFLASLQRPVKAAAAPAVPRRLVIFYTNNGCIVPKWGPPAVDGALDPASFAGTTLEPVGELASKLLIPRGLAMFPRGQINGYFDPHDQGMGSKLTAAPIDPAGDHWATQRSLDHVAAELVNPAGNAPLVLSVGNSFANVKSIVSYSAPLEPYTPETRPTNVYNQLTGLFGGGMTEADYRVRQGQSVIDLVRGDLDAFKRLNMSTADKQRVDDWLALLRDTEGPIVSAACNAETATALGITSEAVSAASGGNGGRGFADTGTAFTLGGDMMIKLIALTMMCDANRVIILQWPGFVTFNFDGIAHEYDHHGLSHRNGTNAVGGDPIPGVEDMIFEIDRWYGIRYGRLVNLINSIQEGEGTTMLDNSMVMWLPELADGNRHDNVDLPIVIAGSAGGYLKQGQSINVNTSTTTGGRGGAFGSGGEPLNRLHTTLLNALGQSVSNWVPVTSFGTMDNNDSETITKPGELDLIKA